MANVREAILPFTDSLIRKCDVLYITWYFFTRKCKLYLLWFNISIFSDWNSVL